MYHVVRKMKRVSLGGGDNRVKQVPGSALYFTDLQAPIHVPTMVIKSFHKHRMSQLQKKNDASSSLLFIASVFAHDVAALNILYST